MEFMVLLYEIASERSGYRLRIKLERPCRPTKNRSGIMSEKTIQYWIDISEYDLQVAKSLLDKDHYVYVQRGGQTMIATSTLPFSRDAYFGSDAADFVNEIVRKGKVIYMAGRT